LAPPLYGMEARNCGFDDRLLEVNKTERSGWNKDEFKKYDWSENVNSGVISVPYYFNPQPSRRVRSAVEEGLRYVEEHVSCIKFKETPKDRNIKQVEMNIPSRDLCGVNPDSEGVGGSVGLNVEDFTKIEEDQEGKPFLLDWNKRLYLKMTHAPCLDNWYPNDSIAEFTLWYKTFVHELFHVFGITHTMQRVDRDDYINVLYGNIPNTYQDLFQYKKMPSFLSLTLPMSATPSCTTSLRHTKIKLVPTL